MLHEARWIILENAYTVKTVLSDTYVICIIVLYDVDFNATSTSTFNLQLTFSMLFLHSVICLLAYSDTKFLSQFTIYAYKINQILEKGIIKQLLEQG